MSSKSTDYSQNPQQRAEFFHIFFIFDCFVSASPIDPFHLDFRACAMDWRVKSSGSKWDTSAGLLADRIAIYFPSTSNSENLAFHGDKMGAKDHCRVIHCTIGRIKARNPAKRLSLLSVKWQSIVFCDRADSRMIPGPVS